MQALIGSLVLSSLLALPLLGQATPRSTGWATAPPEAAAPLRPVLDSILREIARGDYGNVDRMVVIRGGQLVFDMS